MKKDELIDKAIEWFRYIANDIQDVPNDIIQIRAIGAAAFLEKHKNDEDSKNDWKPTKEQIMSLRYIMNHLPYCTHKEGISELHEQLMKMY